MICDLCIHIIIYDYIPSFLQHIVYMIVCIFEGSTSSYINSVRDNIRKIVEEIVAAEKSDVYAWPWWSTATTPHRTGRL